MEYLFLALFDLVFELVIVGGSEVLGRFLLKILPRAGGLAAVIRRAAALGALFGIISLCLFPSPLIQNKILRIASLAVIPLFVGNATALIGFRAEKKGRQRSEYDTFVFGAIFALVFGLLRLTGQLLVLS